jgi:WD40 repeat protein
MDVTPTRTSTTTERAVFISPVAGRQFITSANLSRVTELARIQPATGTGYGIVGVDFSPDGRYIAIADNAGYILLYDFIQLRMGDSAPVFSRWVGGSVAWDVAFHPYRDWVVGCNGDGTLIGVNFSDVQLFMQSVGRQITQCNYSHDGAILAVATGEFVIFYEYSDGGLRETQRSFDEAGINDVIFSHDDTILYTAGDQNITAWDVATGAQLWRQNIGNTWSINPLPNGNLITTGSDSRVEIYNPDGQLLYNYSGHTMDVIENAYSPDARLFVTGSWDNQLLFWDARGETTNPLYRLDHGEYIVDVGWSRDGALIASVGNNGLLIVWGIP